WSPRANPSTPSPSSTTSPAASWPRISGGGIGIVPLVAERSEWQTPHAPSLTVTSPRRGGSTVTSSTITGLFSSLHTTAFAFRDIARSISRTLGLNCAVHEENLVLIRDRLLIGGCLVASSG